MGALILLAILTCVIGFPKPLREQVSPAPSVTSECLAIGASVIGWNNGGKEHEYYLRLDPETRRLVHSDGTPCFWYID